MNYIQLDNFNGNLSIVYQDNESGEPLIFDTLKEAQETLDENCQNGVIIPLDINIIQVISELANFRLDIFAEEGIENFKDTEKLTSIVNEILDLK